MGGGSRSNSARVVSKSVGRNVQSLMFNETLNTPVVIPVIDAHLLIQNEQMILSTNEVCIVRIYTFMVDPSNASALKFVPTADINGVKCAKIEKSDVQSKTEYWQNVVLCCVLGANHPFDIMNGFVRRL